MLHIREISNKQWIIGNGIQYAFLLEIEKASIIVFLSYSRCLVIGNGRWEHENYNIRLCRPPSNTHNIIKLLFVCILGKLEIFGDRQVFIHSVLFPLTKVLHGNPPEVKLCLWMCECVCLPSTLHSSLAHFIEVGDKAERENISTFLNFTNNNTPFYSSASSVTGNWLCDKYRHHTLQNIYYITPFFCCLQFPSM